MFFMDFERFFSEEGIKIEEPEEFEDITINSEASKIGFNQFYDVITGKKPDWQSIIYDLISTEQLDPWDIDIVVLTNKYFEKIEELALDESEEIDFYVSSKVLLAASLLLRIKSEFLLNKHIKSVDEILFGKKEDEKKIIERIEIDESELPLLVPKTPLPRSRRVTLPELMAALTKAINTESRRIKREVQIKRARRLSEIDIPHFRRIDLKDRIKQFYAKILTGIKKRAVNDERLMNKVSFSQLIGEEREEKLGSFLPLLHLSNSRRLWLEQENHLDEIWIYLYEYFTKNKEYFLEEELEEDIQEMKEELASVDEARDERINSLRIKKQEKRELEEDIAKEIEREIESIRKEEKIENITGFDDEQ
jgi:segregation and condensation protein A